MPIIDACVVVDWVAPGADPDLPAQRLLRRWAQPGGGEDGDVTLVAPQLHRAEVFNALLTGVRRERWSGAEADRAAVLLAELPIEVRDTDADRDRAWELARRYDNWPIYDMFYVALAERLDMPLVTIDDKLRKRLAHLSWVCTPDDL